MKLAEMVDLINKAFLDAVIEKMDKLMDVSGADIDGDLFHFVWGDEFYDEWLTHDGVVEEDDDGGIRIYFNMAKLHDGDPGEIGTAISIISKIESGEYEYLIGYKGGVDLGGIFE